METDQPPKEIVVACLLLDLMLARPLNRTYVSNVVTQLLGHGYSMRQISRETGIPRTTLTRWAAAT